MSFEIFEYATLSGKQIYMIAPLSSQQIYNRSLLPATVSSFIPHEVKKLYYDRSQ